MTLTSKSFVLRLVPYLALFAAVAAATQPSTVTLSVSANPSAYGHAVVLTANITPGATGKITFYDGVNIVGIGTVSGGQASTTTVLLPSGSRSLHAYYSGDSTYASSSSAPILQTVLAAPGSLAGSSPRFTMETTAPSEPSRWVI